MKTETFIGQKPERRTGELLFTLETDNGVRYVKVDSSFVQPEGITNNFFLAIYHFCNYFKSKKKGT